MLFMLPFSLKTQNDSCNITDVALLSECRSFSSHHCGRKNYHLSVCCGAFISSFLACLNEI